MKEIIGSQNQQTSLLETLQSQITNLQDRVEYIETTNSSCLTHIDNPKHLNEHLPVVSPKAGKSPTLPKPHSLQSSICSTNANNPVVNSSPADVYYQTLLTTICKKQKIMQTQLQNVMSLS